MACFQGKAEAEGIIERVPGMKERKEKIDLLIERNTAEQLAGVDWGGLSAEISAGVDKAGRGKASVIRFSAALKAAASVAAAAAVIFIAVMIRPEKEAGVHLADGRAAAVEFLESKDAASVEIKTPRSEASAVVSFGQDVRAIAKCDIKIIDSNGDLKTQTNRSSWIIISMPEEVYAENGFASDMTDIVCMF